MNATFKFLVAFVAITLLATACGTPAAQPVEVVVNVNQDQSSVDTAPAAQAPAALQQPSNDGIVPDNQSEDQPTTVDCGNGRSHFEIKSGETVTVKAGCRISGDVVVDGKVFYDNEGSTGLLIDLKQDAQVFAEWGASVNTTSVAEWVSLMKMSGCESKCTTVDVVTWPQ